MAQTDLHTAWLYLPDWLSIFAEKDEGKPSIFIRKKEIKAFMLDKVEGEHTLVRIRIDGFTITGWIQSSLIDIPYDYEYEGSKDFFMHEK